MNKLSLANLYSICFFSFALFTDRASTHVTFRDFSVSEVFVHILVDTDEVVPTWGPWGEWGNCSVACGGNGFQERFRECTGSDSYQTNVTYPISLCKNVLDNQRHMVEQPCTKSLPCVDGEEEMLFVKKNWTFWHGL